MRRRTYAPWLIAIVGVSFAVRMAVGWLRAVPELFPDEYTYAALGRSIAESGHATIRGSSPGFPALLEPIVTSPAWLVDDVGLAFRLVQAIGALSMSLAAVPVFLLARRLGLTGRVALAVAALSVLVPDLVYASFVSSESVAYPLLLTATYFAVAALTDPRRGNQIGFVAFAGLTTLARVQFGALFAVFVVAVVLVGWRERRLRAALREQLLTAALLVAPVLLAVAAGPGRVLGPYRAVLGFRGSPVSIVHWSALDAMTLAYAAGWIIVPGALLGLVLACRRPQSREELAFGVFASLVGATVLLEAGVLQASLPLGKEIQQRYVFYAVPLLGLAFALYARRGWPWRLAHLGLAGALLLVSVRLPLSGYAIAATLDGSSILYGVYWLSGKLGEQGLASTAVAAAVGLLSVVAVAASRRPRLGTPIALGLAMLACGVASAGAVAFTVDTTRLIKQQFLPSDPSWIDRSGLGKVTLVQAWGGTRGPALQALFWNRSVHRVVLLPGANPIDTFGAERVRVAPDGSLVVDGRPVTGPVLVDTSGSVVRLRGARMVEAAPTAALWRPDRGSSPRLSLYATGRYRDGWLADHGTIYLWPRTAGWLTIRLVSPPKVEGNTITFHLPGGQKTAVHLQRNHPELVHLAVCEPGPWRATYQSKLRALLGLRFVSVRASAPTFHADPGACPAPESLQ